MKLYKAYWYSFFSQYHIKKAKRIGVNYPAALKYHKDMAHFYYEKAFEEPIRKKEVSICETAGQEQRSKPDNLFPRKQS